MGEFTGGSPLNHICRNQFVIRGTLFSLLTGHLAAAAGGTGETMFSRDSEGRLLAPERLPLAASSPAEESCSRSAIVLSVSSYLLDMYLQLQSYEWREVGGVLQRGSKTAHKIRRSGPT